MKIGGLAMSPDFKMAFAHSLPFLHAMGDVLMGWMLLWRAETAAPKIQGAKGRDLPFLQRTDQDRSVFYRDGPSGHQRKDEIHSGGQPCSPGDRGGVLRSALDGSVLRN